MAKINLYSPLNVPHSVPDGLGVRIPGFHPGGPGSIPGLGAFLLYDFTEIENHSINIHMQYVPHMNYIIQYLLNII